MDADPRDDFAGFAGFEHMFFGLVDPLRMIREDVERGLRKQVPDCVIEAITMDGAPRFLTIARKTEQENEVIVAHFAFCLRATLVASSAASGRRDEIPAALTYLLGHVDRPGEQTCRTHFDLHGDAERGFEASALERRFLEFRATLD
jgi:hypothetical protein